MKWLLLIATVLALTTTSASAQGTVDTAFSYVDPVGAPLAIFRLPRLEPGWYEIQTDNLEPLTMNALRADTVLTLRNNGGVNAKTNAGADDCATPGMAYTFYRSCVRFEIKNVRRRRQWAWIRAWATMSPGTADVKIQRMASATAVPTDRNCTTGAVQSRCWTQLASNVTFGGMVVHGPRLGTRLSGPVKFETSERPGAGATALPSYHAILFTGDNDDVEQNWRLRKNRRGAINGGPKSHPNRVAGTAQWLGLGRKIGLSDTDPWSNTLIAGPTSAYAAGPFRFSRNDLVPRFKQGRRVIVGIGVDVDRDGLGENLEQILRTCDSVTSPDAGGMRCRDLPGCDLPSSALCKAALRDSDGDGIRDDHELYGVALYGGRVEAGTELARFGADPAHYDVFLEIDYDGTRVRTRCVDNPAAVLTRTELRNITQVFDSQTAFRNRDGRRGISLHIDAGVTPLSPDDVARYGDWGGSQRALCSSDWQSQMAKNRRWLFRHSNNNATVSGQAGFGVQLATNAASTVPHELGHTTGLNHNGPRSIVGTKGLNGNPLYPSLMSYLYQSYTDLTTPGLVSTQGFSDGDLISRAFKSRAMDEMCPYGPGGVTQAIKDAVLNGSGAAWDTQKLMWEQDATNPDCIKVDWNRNGVYDTAPVQARIQLEDRHKTRETLVGDKLLRTRTSGDITVAGNVVVRASISPTATGAQATLHVSHDIECNECLTADNDNYDACWQTEDEQILIQTANGPVDVVSLALTTVQAMGGGETIVYVARTPSDLQWGTLNPATLVLQPGGAIPVTSLPSLKPGEEHVAVVRDGRDGKLLLAYRTEDRRVFTVQGQALTARYVDWQPEVWVRDVGRALGGTSIGLATQDGDLGDGLLMLLGGPRSIAIYNRAVGDAIWRPFSTLTSPASGSGSQTVRGRPFLAQTSYAAGNRLVATWISVDGQHWYGETKNDGTWIAGKVHGNWAGAYPIPLAWDDRPNARPAGLRGVYSQRVSCTTATAAAQCGALSCVGGFCQSADGFQVLSKEYLLPFVDGVVPAQFNDYDDKAQLRYGFCAVLRICERSYQGSGCVPDEYAELDPDTGAPFGERLCAPEPSHTVSCTATDQQ